jgi:site-specific recombinase XerD
MILKAAFNELKMTGKISSHVMRKSYCIRVHKALGEKIEKTQRAMCHRSISSTVSYLQIDSEEITKAILGLG